MSAENKNKILFTNLEEKEILFKQLLRWQSPDRHWEAKSKAWYVSYSLFFIILIAINVILENFFFVVLIITFAFLWFLQATVPPVITEHSITTLGIRTYGKVFKWKSIKHFWFSNKAGVIYLNLEILDEYFTKSDRIQRLSIIIDETILEKLFNMLISRINYGDKSEVAYNFLDRVSVGRYIDISNFIYFENSEKTSKF